MYSKAINFTVELKVSCEKQVKMDGVKKDVLTGSVNISVSADHVASKQVCSVETLSISSDISNEILEVKNNPAKVEESVPIHYQINELKAESETVSELKVELGNFDKLNLGSDSPDESHCGTKNDELNLGSVNVDKPNIDMEKGEVNLGSENVDESHLETGNDEVNLGSENEVNFGSENVVKPNLETANDEVKLGFKNVDESHLGTENAEVNLDFENVDKLHLGTENAEVNSGSENVDIPNIAADNDKVNLVSENVDELHLGTENDEVNLGSENVDKQNIDTEKDEVNLGSENVDKPNIDTEEKDEVNLGSENVDKPNIDTEKDEVNLGSENVDKPNIDTEKDEVNLGSENVDELSLGTENDGVTLGFGNVDESHSGTKNDEINLISYNVDDLGTENVELNLASEIAGEDPKEEVVSLTMIPVLPECVHSEKIVTGNGEKLSFDVGDEVNLKRKSDSLALLSSYQISSDSEDGLDHSAFSKAQVQSETDSDSSTDSESNVLPVFNSDSDVASESEEEVIPAEKKKKSKARIRAPGELGIADLPPINELQISVKEEECLPFGKVHSIVETLVVIESLPDVPALNLDSVLFTKIGHPLGEIFDVFGPVKKPYYTIRFNSQNDIKTKSLSVGSIVYCAPKTKYTQYVFIHQLARVKGSDASWRGDLEPPPGYVEYSDDEEERNAKKKKKGARLKYLSKKIVDVDEPPKKCPSFEERMNHQNTIRNQLFSKLPGTLSKRSTWVNSSSGSFAPGAGRPKPEEGTSKGHVRSSNFSAPAFQRQAPSAPPSFPFTGGSGFHTPPPAVHGFGLRNNQLQHNSFANQCPGNIFSSQNHMNGNRPGSQIYQPISSGFQQASSTYHHNGQEFSSQNFASLNQQPFPIGAPPPFPPSLVGGYQPNHAWPSNNQTFGGQPSFSSSAHSFQNICPPFKTNNAPGFSQSNQQTYDNQGLLANTQQPFSQNNPFCSSGVGSYQPNGFLPDSNPFPPGSNKPFPQQFQQNCPPFQGQSFQTGYSLPNNYPYPGSGPSFPQGPPPFIQNNQLYSTNVPNYPQANNSAFSQSCGPYQPK